MVWWGLLLICLVVLLYQSQALQRFYVGRQPINGGIYNEAVVGQVKTINPILPDNSASVDVSRLVFSGLTRLTPDGKLEGDLADSWKVSEDGLKYTFKLKKNVKWQDGVGFDASDVVFTITAIQHPDSRSPLAADWKGVKASAPDNQTVVFTLPNPYVGFVYLTTVGILPRHLLESIDPSTLRVINFNQSPIGTGPFKVKSFTPGSTAVMEANPNYFRGRPKLDGFELRFFKSADQALEAFTKRQVNAVSRLEFSQTDQAAKIKGLKLLRYRTTEETNLFLRTPVAPLDDKQVRQALVLATDRRAIVSGTLGNLVRPLSAPLLPGQLGYSGRFAQPRYNLAKAQSLLEAAGWKTDGGGRRKNGQLLQLEILTLSEPRLVAVAREVKKQWQSAGIMVNVKSVGIEELIQSHIKPRQYQVLLYGIEVGVDPDVYPYWHSSQIHDPGLNLSQYKSSAADAALEVGRIVNDPDVRAGKYQAFLAAFKADAPAVILYGDDYYYGVSDDVNGVQPGILSQPADRFYGVENWTVRTRPSVIR